MLEFIPLQPNREVAEKLVTWYNDPSSAHLIRLNRREKPIEPVTLDEMLSDLEPRENFWRYKVLLDHQMIAEANLMTNPLIFLKDPDSTAWLSLVVDPAHRYRGHGEKILAFLEQEAIRRYFSRIEFGSFANNTAAIALYQKSGYHHFDTVEKLTWFDGEWIDDWRFEKRLPQTTANLLADSLAGLIHLLKCFQMPQAIELQEQLMHFRNHLDISAYQADGSLNSATIKPYLTKGKETIENAIFVSFRHLSYQLLQAYKSGQEVKVYSLQAPPALLSALAKGMLIKLIDDIMKV